MEWKPRPKGALDHQVVSAVQGMQQEGMQVPPWQQQQRPPQQFQAPQQQPYPQQQQWPQPQNPQQFGGGMMPQQQQMPPQQGWGQPQMPQQQPIQPMQQQFPPQPMPQQYPPQMQMPPPQMQRPMNPPPQQVPPGILPPGVNPPQPQQARINPTKKKRRLLYILTGTFIFMALLTIVTAVYFYVTYVK